MADRVIEANYENMINALQNASKAIYDDAAQLLMYASTCANALGERDTGAANILSNVQNAQRSYAECSAEAMNIAAAMQEELEEIQKEKDVWADDDIEE